MAVAERRHVLASCPFVNAVAGPQVDPAGPLVDAARDMRATPTWTSTRGLEGALVRGHVVRADGESDCSTAHGEILIKR